MLYIPAWPEACGLPISVSQVLRLQACCTAAGNAEFLPVWKVPEGCPFKAALLSLACKSSLGPHGVPCVSVFSALLTKTPLALASDHPTNFNYLNDFQSLYSPSLRWWSQVFTTWMLKFGSQGPPKAGDYCACQYDLVTTSQVTFHGSPGCTVTSDQIQRKRFMQMVLGGQPCALGKSAAKQEGW